MLSAKNPWDHDPPFGTQEKTVCIVRLGLSFGSPSNEWPKLFEWINKLSLPSVLNCHHFIMYTHVMNRKNKGNKRLFKQNASLSLPGYYLQLFKCCHIKGENSPQLCPGKDEMRCRNTASITGGGHTVRRWKMGQYLEFPLTHKCAYMTHKNIKGHRFFDN